MKLVQATKAQDYTEEIYNKENVQGATTALPDF